MSVPDLCLIRSRGPCGEPVVRLGMPLVDGYLEFLDGRCRPNTVLAAAYDLRVFFTHRLASPPSRSARPTCWAGVTRATVYRHFPDAESLFLACSGQWLSRQLLPDPDAWDTHDDPFAVLHTGLTDIYRYFRDCEPMLTSVPWDAAVVPARVKQARLAREREWRADASAARAAS